MGMLRPGGLLLQDIQLATLGFIPPNRWWESIYLANTLRGPPDRPERARRAEITNLAARHIHDLRGRLRDGAAIVTTHHAYRLAENLRVGRVTARESSKAAKQS